MRCYAYGYDIGLGVQILILSIRKLALQIVDLGTDLTLNIINRGCRILHTETARIGNTTEVGDRELGVIAITIHHDTPHKKRKNGLGELLEVIAEIEDAMIVECYRHAYIMQRRGVTLKILDGIHVGVKHIWTVKDALRLASAALYQIVVIGIYAGNHIAPQDISILHTPSSFLQKIHEN